MAIGSFGTSFTQPAPVVQPPTPPTPPPAPVTQAPKVEPTPTAAPKDSANISSEAKESGSGGGLSGYLGKLGDTWKQANTTFDLNDNQKAIVGKASETLKKLAGPDGKWNADDMADNIQAIKAGLGGGFGAAAKRGAADKVAEAKLSKGFEDMSGQKPEPLTDTQKSEAEARWNAKTPEEQKQSAITEKELGRFEATTEFLKKQAQAKGLPESKFENGMPANFLNQILENQPAWAIKLNSLLPAQETK